jgi:hypothetical protein
MPRFVIVHRFVDNNDNTAECRLYTGPGASHAGAVSMASALAPLLSAISDAHLFSFNVSERVTLAGTPPAALTSDVRRGAVLFYRNSDDTASLLVPSVPPVHFETTGPFSGKRITRKSAQLSGLLSALDMLASGALDGAGRPYGDYFSVGGATEI